MNTSFLITLIIIVAASLSLILFRHRKLSDSTTPVTPEQNNLKSVLFEQSVDELSEVNEIIELRVGRFPLPRGKKSASTDCSNTTLKSDDLSEASAETGFDLAMFDENGIKVLESREIDRIPERAYSVEPSSSGN
jgi:hypothetical protein